jgi:hypothetical protein
VTVSGFLQVLCLSIEKNLNPTIEYLVSVIGVPREKVAGVLCKKPQLFGYVSDKMQRTISFLRDEVSNHHILVLPCSTSPGLICTWTDSAYGMQVGVSEQGIRDMVVRFPAVLGYSVDANLRPTLSCLRESGNLSAERLAQGKIPFPLFDMHV